MNKKLLVIGGVAAGMSAASKARRMNPELEITAVTDDRYISYAGCGLPYFIGGRIPKESQLLARRPEDFAQQNINVKTRIKAREIHPEQNYVVMEDLETGRISEESYDRLLICTGARPFIPNLEAVDLDGVFALRTIQDSQAIKTYLNQHKPKKALIVGGGYIGLEMVENLLEYGCEVILLERSTHLLPNMDEDMALILTSYLQSRGVEVRTSENLVGFAGDTRVREAITDRGNLPVDFALLSIGVIPNSEIAVAAGVEPGIRNAIRVNERMETNLPGIFAAGDCATTRHLVSDQEAYIPMGTTANKQGRVAGENAAGGNAHFSGVLGTGIVRAMEMELSRTGLSEDECRQLGIDFISRRIKSHTAAHYCPVSGNIHVKIVAEKASSRILGAQIVGFAGAAMRIDMLAVAITMRATVESLLDMDLAYSPPFSPVWDPVLIALNQF